MKPKKLITLIFLLTFSSHLWAFSAFSYSFNGTAALKPTYMPASYAKSISHIKGAIGEYLTEDYVSQLKKTGWVSLTPRNAAQGIDHVFLKFKDDGGISNLIIGETKFKNGSPSSFLGNTKDGWQMSENWVSKRMYKDVIPQYNSSPYLMAEESNAVVLVQHKPQSAKIEQGSVTYIDKDSFYYKRKGDIAVYFYDGSNKYPTGMARSTQMKRVGDALSEYVDHGIYRRRLFEYQFDSNNVLTQKIYDVIEEGVGEKPLLIPSKTISETKFTSNKAKNSVADSPEFKNAILARYGLEDDTFFDEIKDVNSKLRLVNEVDVDAGMKILSSKKNRTALANKYGLNPDLDFSKITITDSEMKKLFTSKSLDELPDTINQKLVRASRNATLKNACLFGGLGFITSFAGEMIINNWELSRVNWAFVGYTTGVMTASSLLQRAAQKGIYHLVADTATKSTAMKVLAKIAPGGLAIGLDTLTDLAFTAYDLYNGNYTLKQATAVTGLNIGANVAIYFISHFASGVVTGIWGGPVGSAVGGTLAVLLSVGTTFIINPVTNQIQLSDTLNLLNSNSRYVTVCSWTAEYLGEAI